MDTLRQHPKTLMAVAYGIAAVVVAAIALNWGPTRFLHAFSHTHPAWLILVIGGAIIAPGAYTVCYDALTRIGEVPELPLGLAARIVAMGFGPFVPAGGLQTDKRALQAIDGDEADAGTHVFAMGLLEVALMTPVAWACALILLIDGNRAIKPSNLWPWIILVPVGFGIGLYAISWVKRRRPSNDQSGVRGAWIRAGYGGSLLLQLPVRPRHGWPVLAGMIGYWILDIASFYAAARFIGIHINLAELILAYATGYVLTRRSVPLGGAGVTEALLTFSLHWVGQPISSALAVVVVYRVFNFVLPAVPALMARERVAPLVAQSAPGG